MSKQIQVAQQSVEMFNEEQIKTLKDTIAKGATDGELKLFIAYCTRTGLDPFANQIFFIKRGSGQYAKASFQTSIDGFRSIAENNGNYAGQTEVEFGEMITVTMYYKDANGEKKGVQKQVPSFAKVGVYRKDFEHPTYAVAYWEEYCPSYPNQMMWSKMPRVMLAKVAEALALRKAFPKQMAGVYTREEMDQADDLPNVAVVAKTEPKPEGEKKVENLPINPGDNEIDEVLDTKVKIVEPPPLVPVVNFAAPTHLVNAVQKLIQDVEKAETLADYAIIDGKLVVALDKVKEYPGLLAEVEKAGELFATKFSLLKKGSVEIVSDEFVV